MSISEDYDDGVQYLTVENQCYTDEDIENLRLVYDVFFMSKGKESVIPVKVEKTYKYKGKQKYAIVLGSEDDGTIYFNNAEDVRFDAAWLDGLIADLRAAKKYLEELNEGV